MKRIIFAIIVCSSLGMAASTAFAGGPSSQAAAPSRAQIQQQAMQNGPATPQIGYLTQKDPVAPYRSPAPPRLLRPLTQREIGMTFVALKSVWGQSNARLQNGIAVKLTHSF